LPSIAHDDEVDAVFGRDFYARQYGDVGFGTGTAVIDTDDLRGGMAKKRVAACFGMRSSGRCRDIGHGMWLLDRDGWHAVASGKRGSRVAWPVFSAVQTRRKEGKTVSMVPADESFSMASTTVSVEHGMDVIACRKNPNPARWSPSAGDAYERRGCVTYWRVMPGRTGSTLRDWAIGSVARGTWDDGSWYEGEFLKSQDVDPANRDVAGLKERVEGWADFLRSTIRAGQ